MDPFSYLSIGSDLITSDKNIRDTATSLYQLFLAIGVVGLMTTFILTAVSLAKAPPAKRPEVFDDLKIKFLIGICLFGMTTILSLIFGALTNIL